MWLSANVITSVWGGVPSGTLSMLTGCSNLKFLSSLWLKYIDFQNGYFANFEQFKIDIYFANFGQVIIGHIFSLLLLWIGHSYFTCLGKLCGEKQSKASVIKIQEPHIESGTRYIQWLNQQESRTGFLRQ